MHVWLTTHDTHGAVKVEWEFFTTAERHEEVHVNLPTALARVALLVRTTEDERVREYQGSPLEFARRVRDFIVTTTA